jgi:hypothetical protein
MGILMMIFGMINAGLTYRDMRTQRLLNETVSLMKLDLTQPSSWQSAPLPLYETGDHPVYLAGEQVFTRVSHTKEQSLDSIFFAGRVDITVEDPTGEKVFEKALSGILKAIPKASGMMWIVIDTLHLPNIGNGEWKLNARVAVADTSVRTLTEILVVPPHAAEFSDYVSEETPKLFGMGILIIAGFCTTVFGGYLNRRAM